MTVFERYLTVWVFLCIVIGMALGQLFPGVVQVIGGLLVAQVNLPVGANRRLELLRTRRRCGYQFVWLSFRRGVGHRRRRAH